MRTARSSATSMITASSGSRPQMNVTTQSSHADVSFIEQSSQSIVNTSDTGGSPCSYSTHSEHAPRVRQEFATARELESKLASGRCGLELVGGRRLVEGDHTRAGATPAAGHRFDPILEHFLVLDGQVAADGEVVERRRAPSGRDGEAGQVAARRAAVAAGTHRRASVLGPKRVFRLGLRPHFCPPEIPLRSRQLLDRRPSGNPLPEGTLAVGAGLLVLGLTAYAFFVVAARALGPERYSSLSVLWTLVFFAAPGFLFPLEQEVSRAVSARRALGIGGGPVIRRAAILGGGLAALLAIVTLGLSGLLLEHLFDGQILLLVSLVLALPTYAAIHLTRGALSGTGRFRAYGTLLAGEGLLRVAASVVLAVVGVRTTGPFGLLIAGAGAVMLVTVLSRQHGLLEDGPEAPWSELSEALGWLLLGSVLAQAFVNASVPLVKVLAGPGEDAIAGQFQAGLIITRVPLFLFQAVQASLLPKLAGLAASGQLIDFRKGLQRLVVAVIGIGVASTLGAFAVGPLVLRLAFGAEFNKLGNADLGFLALAGAAFMLSTALSQALIALRGYAKVAIGWSIALVVFGLATWQGHGLLGRVELGLVTGSAVSIVAMALLVRSQLRTGPVPATAEPLFEALGGDHEIIEP